MKVEKIASEAAISRQSLKRYYPDLVEYIKGNKNIDELLPGHEPSSVAQLLLKSQERVNQLELTLRQMEHKHEADISDIRDRYITSLMQGDLITFDNSNINLTLEKQSSLIGIYVAQIDQLKAQLTRATAQHAEGTLSALNGSRIVYDLNMKAANSAYKTNKDYLAYSNTKHEKIQNQLQKLTELTSENIHLVIFIDKYLCDLPYLLDKLPSNSSEEIVLRLPIYDTVALRGYIRKIPPTINVSIYIPECRSVADATAQRRFRASTVPPEELEQAEKADHVHLFKGVDRVVHFSVDGGK
ncbi:hypothetical protein G7009_06005 [Pseudomonas capeferrum]|uniref:hypothetical protein n=1 Tax=Pseudomonas capeferrum TaxID=1495066 RepID=UPI0015E29A94|nr:hypothetical protein [Pseudomonas capeferrum]MBA1201322.1 hypothetical protein [Pseudomonas capeferrum]